MTERAPGHSVLVIPVPELNGWVRERTRHYDASFLGSSPEFVNAHITLLGPWISEPSTRNLARVAALAAHTPPFEFSLVDLGAFPDGIIYLEPSPASPFVALTAALAREFPDYPPYGGAFGSVIPHLTLDQTSATISTQSVRASLGGLVPLTVRATRIDLQWWENDNCHTMASWDLGPAAIQAGSPTNAVRSGPIAR